MRISLNASTKPHLCWCSLKSSDLDTSDDFSEELDRSHGFFTASGGGGTCVRDSLIHSNDVLLSVAYLLSSADLGHQSRPAQQRSTASHTHSSPNLQPEQSHTFSRSVPSPLTSSGFSDAFRLGRTNGSFPY